MDNNTGTAVQDPIVNPAEIKGKNVDFFKTMHQPDFDFNSFLGVILPQDNVYMKDPGEYSDIQALYANPAEFNQRYAQTKAMFDRYKDIEHRMKYPERYEPNPIGSQVFGFGRTPTIYDPSMSRITVVEPDFYYTPEGELAPRKSAIHMASKRGAYYDVLTKKIVPLENTTGVTNKQLLEDYWTVGYLHDEDGKITDPQPILKKYPAVNIPMSGIVMAPIDIPNDESLITLFQDQGMHTSAFLGMLGKIVSGALPETAGGIASMFEATHGFVTRKLGIDDTELSKGMDDMLDALVYSMDALSYKAGESLDSQGLTDTWGSFFYHMGSLFGMLVPQRGVAKFANQFTNKKSVIRAAAVGLGTNQAVTDFYKSSLQAGLSEDDSFLLSLVAAPAVATTEWFLQSEWITTGLGTSERKLFFDDMSNSIKNVLSKGVDPSTDAGRLTIAKKVLQYPGIVAKAMQKVPIVKHFAKGAFTEGSQETLEESWYITVEKAFDEFLADDDAEYGEGAFRMTGQQNFKRLKDSFIGGAVAGGFMDMFIGRAPDQAKALKEKLIIDYGFDKVLKWSVNAHKKGQFGAKTLGPDAQALLDSQLGTRTVKDTNGQEHTVSSSYQTRPGQIPGLKYDAENNVSIIENLNDLNFANFYGDISIINEVVTKLGIKDPMKVKAVMGMTEKDPNGNDLMYAALNVGYTIVAKQKELEKARAENKPKEQIDKIQEELNAAQFEFDDIIKPEADGYSRRYKDLLVLAEANNVLIKSKNNDGKVFSLNGIKNLMNTDPDDRISVLKNLMGIKKLISETKKKELVESLTALPKVIESYKKGEVTDQVTAIKELSNLIGTLTSLQEKVSSKAGDQFYSVLNSFEGSKAFLENLDSSLLGIIEALFPDVGLIKSGIETNEGRQTDNYIEDLRDTDLLTIELSDSETEFFQALAQKGETPKDVRNKLLETISNVYSTLESTTKGKEKASKTQDAYTEADDQRAIDEWLNLFYINLNGVDQNRFIEDELKRITKKIEDNFNPENLEILKAALNDIEWKLKQLEVYKAILNVQKGRKLNPSYTKPNKIGDDNYLEEAGNQLTIEEIEENINKLNSYLNGNPDQGITMGVKEALRILGENQQKRNKREQIRRRGKLSQKAWSLHRVLSIDTEKNNFLDNTVKTEANAFLTDIKDIRNQEKVTEDQLIGFEKRFVGILENVYQQLKKSGKQDDFINSTFDRLWEEVSAIVKADENLHGGTWVYSMPKDGIGLRNTDNVYDEDLNDLQSLVSNISRVPHDPSLNLYAKKSVISTWMMNYTHLLNTVTLSSPQQGYNAMRTAYEELNAKKANVLLPSIQQEEAILLGYAILTSSRPFYELSPDKSRRNMQNDKKKGLPGYLIQAIGGAGKTTVTTRMLMNMINQDFKDNNKTAQVLVVGIDNANMLKLEEQMAEAGNIKVHKTTAQTYMNDAGVVNSSKQNYDYIIIDEASRIPIDLFETLYKAFKDKKTRFLMLADPNQSTGSVQEERDHIYVAELMPRSERMNEVFRTGNYDIMAVQVAINESITGNAVEKIPELPSVVKYNETHDNGVRYFKTKQEVIDAWKNDVNSTENWRSRVLIFATQAERNTYAARLKEQLNNAEALNNILWVDDTAGESKGNLETVQGKDYQRVYVAITPTKDTAEKRVFNTAAGRAQVYLNIVSENKSIPVKDIIDEQENQAYLKDTQNKLYDRLKAIADTKREPAIIKEEKGGTSTPPVKVKKTRFKSVNNGIPAYQSDENSVIYTESKDITESAKDKHDIKYGSSYVDPATGNEVTPKKAIVAHNEVTGKNHQYVVVIGDNTEYLVPISKTGKTGSNEPLWKEYQLKQEIPDTSSETDNLGAFTQEPNNPVEKTEYVLRKAALDHAKSGGSVFAVSWGAVDTYWGHSSGFLFSRDHMAQNRRLPNSENLQVVFMKEVDLVSLIDGKEVIRTHHNVLAIIEYDADDDVEQIVGTLFQPIRNQEELEDQKSFDPNTDYTIEANWVGPDSAMLNSYANGLSALYQSGKLLWDSPDLSEEQLKTKQKRGYIKIGDFNVTHSTGGSAIIDVNHRQTVKEFVDKHKGKGLLYKTKSGDYVEEFNDDVLIIQRDQDDKVSDKEDGIKRVKVEIYVSYNGVGSDVRVELRGLPLKNNPEEVKAITKDLLDLGEEFFDVDRTSGKLQLRFKKGKDLSEFIARFNMTKAAQTLRYNKSMFVKDGVLLQQFSLQLKYNQQKDFLTPRSDMGVTTADNDPARAYNAFDNMLSVLNHLQNSGFTNITKTDVSGVSHLNVPFEDLLKMETIVKEIHMQRAQGTISIGTEPFTTSEINNNANLDDLKDDDAATLSKDAVHGTPEKQHNKIVNDYIRTVFGDAVADKNLLFSLNATINNKETFGYVLRRMIVIEKDQNNNVLKGIERHEAVHFALSYIVSPESRNRILRSTKEQMTKDGVKNGFISDNEAEEYLAEVNRGTYKIKRQYKGVTGIIKQFVNWLTDTLWNVKYFGPEALLFLEQLNRGSFKDSPLIYNNRTDAMTMAKDQVIEKEAPGWMDNDTPRMLYEAVGSEPEQVYEESKNVGYLTKGQMISELGSSYQFNRLQRYVGDKVKAISVYNRVLDDPSARTLIEAIETLDNLFLPFDTPENNKLFQGKKIGDMKTAEERDMFKKWFLSRKDKNGKSYFQSLIRTLIPEMSISSDMIEDVIEAYREKPDLSPSHRSLATVVKFHITTIPMYHWKVLRKKENGMEAHTVLKTSPQNKGYVDFTLINNFLMYAAIDSRVAEGKEGLDKIQTWFELLSEKAISLLGEDPDNMTANAILSFLNEYATLTALGKVSQGVSIEKELARNNGKVSFDTLANRLPKIIKYKGGATKESQDAWYDSEEGQRIMKRSKAASELLNAMYSHYSSLQHQLISYVDVKYVRDGEVRFRRKVRLSSSAVEVKKRLKKEILNEWYFENNYRSDAMDRLTRSNKEWIINEKAISFGSGAAFLVYDYAKGVGAWRFSKSYDPKKMPAELRKALQFLGINLSTITIKSIMDPEIKTEMTGDQLINMIGMMMANLQSDVMTEKGEYLDNHDALKKMVLDYLKTNLTEGFQLTEDQINEDTLSRLTPGTEAYNSVAKIVNWTKDKYLLTDFNDEIDLLSAIEAHYQGIIAHDMTWTQKNNKKYLNTLTTPVTRLMVNDEKDFASKTFIRHFERKSRRLSKKERESSPFFGKSGEVLIPIADPKSGLKVFRIESCSGIGFETHGKDADEMNQKDYLNSLVFGYYVTSLFGTREEQRLVFSGDNPADSSNLLLYETSFGSKESYLIKPVYDKEGTLTTFIVNQDRINRLLTPRFESFYKQWRESMKKWANVTTVVNGVTHHPFMLGEDSADKLLWEKGGMPSIKVFDNVIQMLESKVGTIEPNDQNLQILSKAGLVRNVDFVIEKDQRGSNVLKLGKASKMDHDIFNYDNYFYWKSNLHLPANDLAIIRNNMFKDRMKKLSTAFEDQRINIPDNFWGAWPRKYWAMRERNDDRTVKKLKIEGLDSPLERWQWNPLMEAYIYGQFIVSENISAAFFGSDHQTQNALDFQKRYKNVNAQGYYPTIDTVNGMPNRTIGERFKMIPLNDTKQQSELYKKLFGFGKEVELTDGMKMVTRLHWMFYSESFGGTIGNIRPDETTGKTIGVGVNMATGLGRYNKSATLTMNDDMYEHNPVLFDKLMKYFLTANQKSHDIGPNSSDLYEKYKEYLKEEIVPSRAQERLRDYIIKIRNIYGVDLLKNTVSGIEYSSTNKLPVQFQNFMDIEGMIEVLDNGLQSEIMQIEIDTETELMVLNPNQDEFKNTTKRTSQQIDLVGIGDQNQERAYNVNAILSQILINNKVKELKKVNAIGFNESVRKAGKLAMRHRTDINKMISMLENAKISIQTPIVRNAVLPSWINNFNRGTVFMVSGRKAVQMPSTGFIQVYDVEDEFGYTGIATEKDLKENPKLKIIGEKRELRHMQFFTKKDKSGVSKNVEDVLKESNMDLFEQLDSLRKQKNSLTTQLLAEMKKLNADDNRIAELKQQINQLTNDIFEARKPFNELVDNIVPAEVAMQYSYLSELRIKKENRPSLYSLSTIFMKDGKTMNIQGFVKNGLQNGKTKEQIYSELNAWFRGNMPDIDIEKSGVFKHTNNEFTSPDEVGDWFHTFIETLEVIGTRIPGTAPSVGFAGEIVSILYDSNSTIYTSPFKNLFDDSDYDIDQLTITFRSLEKEQRKKDFDFRVAVFDPGDEGRLDTQVEEQLNNGLFDLIRDYYLDPVNIGLIGVSVELSDARQRAEEKRKEKEETHFYHDVTTSSESFIASHDGKNLIAHFANSIRTYAKLSQMDPKAREKYLPGFKFNEDGTTYSEDEILNRTDYVIGILGEMAQLTVDNPKELIMGLLNINEVSSSLVAAMVLSNYTKDQIYEFLDDDTVKGVIKDIIISRSLGNTTVDPYDAVIAYKENLKNYQNPEHIIGGRNNSIVNRKNELEVKNTQLSNIIKGLDKEGKEKEKLEPVDVVWNQANSIMSEQGTDSSNEQPPSPFNKEEADNLLWEIEKIKKEIAELEKMSDDEYVDAKIAYYDKRIQVLNEMADLIAKGEFLRWTGVVFAMNQGNPVKDYDIYNLKESLEFFTLMSLNDIVSDQDPTSLKDLDEYGINKIGYEKRNKEKTEQAFLNSNQNQIDSFMEEVLVSLDMMIAEEPSMKGVSINLKSTGESGFAEASLKYNTDSWQKESIMRNGRRFKTAEGREIVEYELLKDKPSSGRFEKVKITDTKHKSAWYTTKAVINGSDVVFNFKTQQNYSHTNASNAAGGKYVEFSEERLNPHNAVTIAKVMFDKIKGSVPVNNIISIGIIGSDLHEINSPRKLEFEYWKEHQLHIRAQGNMKGIIKSLDIINEYVTEFSEIHDMLANNIAVYSKEYNEIVKLFYQSQKIPRFYYKNNYYAFQEAFNKAIVGEYFRRNGEVISLADRGNYGNLGFVTLDPQNIPYINHIDLRTSRGQFVFLLEFPRYVMDFIQEVPAAQLNDFLMRLTVENNTLLLRDRQSMNTELVDHYNAEFRKLDELDPNLSRLFAIYNFLRNGYENRMSGFNDFIKEEQLEEFSLFFDEFADNLKYKRGSVAENDSLWQNIRENFIDNAIQYQVEKLINYVKKDDLSAGRDPNWIPQLRRIKVPGTEIVRSQFTVAAKKDEKTGEYNLRNQVTTKRSAVIPLTFANSTVLEVIHDLDVAQQRQWLKEGKIRITFNRFHGYKSTVTEDPKSFAFVMGDLSRINKLSDSVIELTRETPISASKNLGGGRRISRKAFRTLFNVLKKANSRFDFRIVNNSNTQYPGLKGYSVGNTMYYNEDLITMDTLVHEFMHPIVIALKSNNSTAYQQLYQDALGEINGNTPLAVAISAKYPELFGDSLIEEVIVTKLGFISEQKVLDYIPNASTRIIEKFKNWAIRQWNDLKYLFGNLFATGFNPSKIDYNASYSTISSELIESAFTGETTLTDDDIEILKHATELYSSRDKAIIKPGVSELFESNPELTNIGTQEQYSQYLDTIFPNSKVKDIVYHGTNEESKNNILNAGFDKTKGNKKSYVKDGFWFSAVNHLNGEGVNDTSFYSTMDYGDHIVQAIINSNNPEIQYGSKTVSDSKNTAFTGVRLKQSDSIIVRRGSEKDYETKDSYGFSMPKGFYIVFEPKQIHILGSKEDIKGFKEFVSKNKMHASKNLASKDIVEPKNIKEVFEDLLLLPDGVSDVDSFRKKGVVNTLYTELLLSKDKTYGIYDKEFDFKKAFEIPDPVLMEKTVKKQIMDEIIPVYENQAQRFKHNFKDWLTNEGTKGEGALDYQTRLKYFGIPGSNTRTYYSAEELRNIKNYMDWSQGTTVLFYSDLKHFSKLYPELASAFKEEFIGNDPLILIHGVRKDSDGNNIYDISIFDVSPSPLHFHGVGIEGQLITSHVASEKEARANGVEMPATLHNARNLQVAIQMMSLVSQTKRGNIVVHKSGVVELLKKGSQSNVKASPLNMATAISTLQFLAQQDSFMEAIPSELANLLLDDEVYNLSSYYKDFPEMLLSYSKSKAEEYKTTGKKENKKLTNLIAVLEDFISTGKNPEALLAAIRDRQEAIENSSYYKLTTIDSKFRHLEYRLLSNTAYELESYVKNGNKRSINYLHFLFSTQYRLPNEVLQNYTALERNKFRQINGIVKNFILELNDKIEVLNKLYYKENVMARGGDYLFDLSGYKYERLFIMEEINGEMVNMFRVHWDEKDQRTIAALNNKDEKKRLTKEELEIGKFIAEKTDEYVRRIMRHYIMTNPKYHHDLYKDGKMQEDVLDQMVEKMYASNWEKGMIPVMSKSSSEYVSDKKLTKAWNRLMHASSNPELAFDDILDVATASGKEDGISSQFMRQFIDSESSSLGGKARMQLMGFEQTNEMPQFADINKNRSLTTNLNTIMRYLAYDATAYPIIDKDIMPALVDAQIMALTLQYAGEGNQDMVLKYLKVRSDKIIFGKHQKTVTKNHPELQPLSSGVRMALNVVTFNGVALSLPVAITSLTSNTVESITYSIASSFANPYRIFTFKDWTEALWEMVKNPKKAEKILSYYNVIESDKWDIIGSSIYDPTQKMVFTRRHFHGMNRWTDITMKSAAAIAQMIYEGTYYAHSLDANGKVVYDPALDKRYKDNTEEQIRLRDWYRDELLNDFRYKEEQKNNPLPIRAYDAQDQGKLAMVGSMFVTGVFERDGTSMGNNYLTYSVVMQFKMYLNAKLEERIGHHQKSLEGSYKVVYKNELDQWIREQRQIDTEGSWKTVFDNSFGAIPFIQEALTSLKIVDFVLSRKKTPQQAARAWSQLGSRLTKGLIGKDYGEEYDLDVFNIIRASMDVIWLSTAILLYTGLQGLKDDDKELVAKSERLLKAFQKAFMVSITASPKELLDMVSGIPLLTQAKRMWDLVTLNNSVAQIPYLMPFGGTAKVIQDFIPGEE